MVFHVHSAPRCVVKVIRHGLFAVALGLACSTARSQVLVRTFLGESAGDGLGRAVKIAGDIDGDGFCELIVGATGSDNNGADSGSVLVYSGLSGDLFYRFDGEASGDGLGVSVDGAGDVNGDGWPDFIAGAPWGDHNNVMDTGAAFVYSGLDGSTLHSFYGLSADDGLGWSVGGAGDVNADGYADVVVGSPGDDSNGPDSGAAHVFSGFDGSLLYVFHGVSPGDGFGMSVSDAGDVDADGHADVIVGSPFADAIGNDSGSARVFSGMDGSVLLAFYGSSGDSLGVSVSNAGDVNGDGWPDLIVGAINEDTNGPQAGSALVYSGWNGSILLAWYGAQAWDGLGWQVADLGDVNADGHEDVGIANARGTIFANSGSDGSLLYALGLETTGAPVYYLGGNGDVNGDGFSDFIVGNPSADDNGPNSGVAYVFSGHEHIVPFCLGDGSGGQCPCGNPGGQGEGCANAGGSGAVLFGFGTASVGLDDLAFAGQQLIPSQAALLFAGINAVNGGNGIPLGDGIRCAGGSVVRLGIQAPDGSGDASWGPGLGAMGGWGAGDTRRFQVWYRDPGGPCGTGFNLTNGVEVAFSL